MSNREKNTYTKKQILNATIELFGKKNLTKISILEITTLAGVSRATFYRHFTSIKDVLSQHEEMLALQFASSYANIKNTDISTFFYELSKHYLLNKEFYLTLYKQNLTELIAKTIQKYVRKQIVPKNNIEKYSANFMAYGLYGWIVAWLNDEMKLSPDELLVLMKKTYGNLFDINKAININNND